MCVKFVALARWYYASLVSKVEALSFNAQGWVHLQPLQQNVSVELGQHYRLLLQELVELWGAKCIRAACNECPTVSHVHGVNACMDHDALFH